MRIDATTVEILCSERSIEPGDKPSLFVEVHALPVLGLDRSHVYGWSVGEAGTAKATNMAARLQAAVLSGKAFQGEAEPKTDVKGRTYLSAPSCSIMGRSMSADLRRLGF